MTEVHAILTTQLYTLALDYLYARGKNFYTYIYSSRIDKFSKSLKDTDIFESRNVNMDTGYFEFQKNVGLKMFVRMPFK